MPTLFSCILAPRLYRINKFRNEGGRDYEPNNLESGCDSVVKWVKFCWHLSYWTSPVLLTFLYRRGTFTYAGLFGLGKILGGVGMILFVAILIRGVGRYTNKEYITFLVALAAAKKSHTSEAMINLQRYDSEFSAWPVEYTFPESNKGDTKAQALEKKEKKFVTTPSRAFADKIKALPCHILSYIAAHTFGRRMLYPGATALIQTLIGPMLTQGRTKLYEEKKGWRAKLLSEDKNEIDTMFIDRRNSENNENGNTLVISCEGNSGFYELGCMCTPMEAGYSCLGWNHPGFWGSSGEPFPDQEQKAIDVVIQYAINKLGFAPREIVMFAWSIGGYTATWAAMTYPDIKYVVLDATFDDVVHLAIPRMPQSWSSLVVLTVKKYLNLNNAEQLCKYPGPVLLIRRSRDEMITTVDPSILSSNRGNDLLIKLLKYRYPRIVDDMTIPSILRWLSINTNGQRELWSNHQVDEDLCNSTFRSYVTSHSESFPMELGDGLPREEKIQLALFLASQYMDEYDSTHCTPLPGIKFRIPWSGVDPNPPAEASSHTTVGEK